MTNNNVIKMVHTSEEIRIYTPFKKDGFSAAAKIADSLSHWNRGQDKQFWTFHNYDAAKKLLQDFYPHSEIKEEWETTPPLESRPCNYGQEQSRHIVPLDNGIIAQDDSFNGLIFRLQLELNRLGYDSITVNKDYTHTVHANQQLAIF